MMKASTILALIAACLLSSPSVTLAAGTAAGAGSAGGGTAAGRAGMGISPGSTNGIGAGVPGGAGSNSTGINQPGTPSEQTSQPSDMNTNPGFNTH